MSSEWIIGALALITIGGTLGLAVFHFGFHLKDPDNFLKLAAAMKILLACSMTEAELQRA